jgi:hypothetical protein
MIIEIEKCSLHLFAILLCRFVQLLRKVEVTVHFYHYLLPAVTASSRSFLSCSFCSSLNCTSADTSCPNPLRCCLLVVFALVLCCCGASSINAASTNCFSLPILSTCTRYLFHSAKNPSRCSGFAFVCSRNCIGFADNEVSE